MDKPACLTGISNCSDITSCSSAGTNPIILWTCKFIHRNFDNFDARMFFRWSL